MRWNPLTHLIKTKKYRSAHIFGSSFYRRIKDTFHLFYGSIYGTEQKNINYGLLDYIYPLARISEIPLDWLHADGTETKKTFIAALLLVFTAFIFNIPKLIIATLLTTLATPFVALVHLALKPKVRKLNEKIPTIKVALVEKNESSNVWSQIPLSFEKEVALKTAFPGELINNLLIRPVHLRSITDDKKMIFVLNSDKNTETYLGLFHRKQISLIYPGGALLGVIKLSSENADAIQAMLKINKFRSTETISMTNTLTEVTQKINLPKLVRQAFNAGLSKSSKNTSTLKTLTKSPIFDKNTINLIFFYSGYANTIQTKIAENMIRDIDQETRK